MPEIPRDKWLDSTLALCDPCRSIPALPRSRFVVGNGMPQNRLSEQ